MGVKEVGRRVVSDSECRDGRMKEPGVGRTRSCVPFVTDGVVHMIMGMLPAIGRE